MAAEAIPGGTAKRPPLAATLRRVERRAGALAAGLPISLDPRPVPSRSARIHTRLAERQLDSRDFTLSEYDSIRPALGFSAGSPEEADAYLAVLNEEGVRKAREEDGDPQPSRDLSGVGHLPAIPDDNAMHAKDQVRLRSIRSLRAALLEKEIEQREGGTATLTTANEASARASSCPGSFAPGEQAVVPPQASSTASGSSARRPPGP